MRDPFGQLYAALSIRRFVIQAKISIHRLDSIDSRGSHRTDWFKNITSIEKLRYAGIARNYRIHASRLRAFGCDGLDVIANGSELLGMLSDALDNG